MCCDPLDHFLALLRCYADVPELVALRAARSEFDAHPEGGGERLACVLRCVLVTTPENTPEMFLDSVVAQVKKHCIIRVDADLELLLLCSAHALSLYLAHHSLEVSRATDVFQLLFQFQEGLYCFGLGGRRFHHSSGKRFV